MSYYQLKKDLASFTAAIAALSVYLNNLNIQNQAKPIIPLGVNKETLMKVGSISDDKALWYLYAAAIGTEFVAALIFVAFTHFVFGIRSDAVTQEKKYVVGHTSLYSILHIFFRSASFTYSPEQCKMNEIEKAMITVGFKTTVSLVILLFWPYMFGLEFIGGAGKIASAAFAMIADIFTSLAAETSA